MTKIVAKTLREDLIDTLILAAYAWEQQSFHNDNRTRHEVAVDALVEWLREDKFLQFHTEAGGGTGGTGYAWYGNTLADLLETE